MGWRDQSTPLNQAAAPAPQPSAPQSGWRSQSTPLDQTAAPSAAPSSAPAAASDIAQPDTLPGLDPRTATTGDYFAKLYQAAGGLGQIGQFAADYGRRAANVYGEGDSTLASLKALGGDVTGQRNDYLSNLAAERAKTAAAGQRIGPAGELAANMTGAGPLGAVAQGLKTAPYVSSLPGWLASRVAGGTVGAGSAALGASGRGEDVGLPTLIGGAVGAAVGAPGGGARGPLAQSVDEAGSAESAAYFPTHSVDFPKYKVSDAYYDAANSLSKDQQAGLSSGFNSTVARHLKENSNTSTTSASEIDGFQRGVNEAARTNADRVFANGINANLDNVLTNVKPVTPNGNPDPNFATGEAADLLATAKLAASRRMNAQAIAKAQYEAGLPGYPGIGQVAGDWARGELKSNPQFYADPDVNQAMRSVGGAGTWLPPSYLFKHAFAYPLAGGLAGGVHGYETGGDSPWTHAFTEAGTTGGALALASYGLPGARNYLVNKALKEAAPTLTAGAPFAPSSPFADAIRNLLYPQAAAGFHPPR